MSRVISSLLVGIGYDFDKKSTREVESSFDGVKSSALRLGAVVAGAFGVKSLTTDFSETNDALGKFAETYGLVANDVAAFDRVLQKSGGEVGDFVTQIAGLERLRAATLTGDFGFIKQAEIAGVDTSGIIDAENAIDALLSLADQFNGATQKQRLNMAKSLGLNDASIRMLSQGRDIISDLVKTEKTRRPITQEMINASTIFNENFRNLRENVGGIADGLSMGILPKINEITEITNKWMENNKAVIDGTLAKGFKLISENIGLISVGLSAIVIPPALAAAAALALKFGPTGLVATSATGGAYTGGVIFDNLPKNIQQDIGEVMAINMAKWFGSEESISALSERNVEIPYALPSVSPKQATSAARQSYIPEWPKIKQPDIYIKNQVILDGSVIEDSVIDVIDRSLDNAVNELESAVQ